MARKPGCIMKRGEGYSVVLDLGKGPDGKRRRRWHSGFRTKKEADAFLKRVLYEAETGAYVEPTKLTTAGWLGKWLESYAKPSVEPTTFDLYSGIVRVHLIPAIGGLPLSKLTPVHIQDMLARIQAAGRSSWTLHNIFNVIRKSLADAMKAGLVARNVADLVNKPKQERKPRPTLDPEEARRFLEAAREDRLHALWVLAITAGLRRGELLGLRWQDVDLDAGTLSITQAMKRVGGKLSFGEPKTAKSRRLVELTPTAVDALRRHRLEQKKERLAFGPEYQDGGLVFCQVNGKPLDPVALTKHHLRRLLKKAGITTDIHLHDLRHTCATLLLKQGVHPKVVQERLGHSQIRVTLDTYSHVLPGMQREAGEKLDSLLFGEGTEKKKRQG